MSPRSLTKTLVVCALLAGTVDAADDTFDSKGVKIRYVTEGAGEPVVLIHGWMGDSSMWGRDAAGNTKLKGAESTGHCGSGLRLCHLHRVGERLPKIGRTGDDGPPRLLTRGAINGFGVRRSSMTALIAVSTSGEVQGHEEQHHTDGPK
jgi:hypothetical protein